MPESDLTYMKMALEEAFWAAERQEVPVGAVLVAEDGQILARTGNRTEELSDPTAHAEIMALREAGAKLGSPRMPGVDLFVTLEPCAMCAAALSFARIRRVVFGASDPKGGAVENGPRFYAFPTCHHRPEIVSGIEAEASAELLRKFFQARRGK